MKGQNLNLAYQYSTKLQMLFGYLRRCGVFPSRLQHDQHRNQSLLNSPIKKTQKLTEVTISLDSGRSQSFASCRGVAKHPTNVNGVPNSWKPNACDDVFMLEAISSRCKILNNPQDPSPFINVISHGQPNLR